jgi:hypothetical protein
MLAMCIHWGDGDGIKLPASWGIKEMRGLSAMSLNRQRSRPLCYLTELRALNINQKVF